MATLSVAGFSTFTYSFAGGSLVFNTPFALGVLSPAHVQAYVVGELDGLGDQLYRACIYNATSGTTTVVGPLPNPCDVVLQRTVPKDVLFLSFASGADVTRTNIDVAVKYTLMALHETLDGRWDNAAFDALNDAVTAAISARDAALAAMYAAQVSQAASEAAYDSFNDLYLGNKSANPVLDNDGNPLLTGALYFNTTLEEMRVYTGAAWVAAYASLGSVLLKANGLADLLDPSKGLANLHGYATTAKSGGTTTLTASSAVYQRFTGSSAHSVVLPDAGTLQLGSFFDVHNNNAPGTLTVKSADGSTIITALPGQVIRLVCVLASGATAGSWGVTLLGTDVLGNAAILASTNTTGTPSGRYLVTAATGGVLPAGWLPANGGIIDILRGDAGSLVQLLYCGLTGRSATRHLVGGLWQPWREAITVDQSPVAGDMMYFDGSNFLRLAKGTAGQALTMNAGATAPEWRQGFDASGATPGAPRLQLEALPELTPGAVIRSRNDAVFSAASGTTGTALSFGFGQSGTVRLTMEHSGGSGGGVPEVRVVRSRAGSETTLITWTNTSATYVARSVDASVIPGDTISVRAIGGSAAASSVKNCRIQTNGERLWPFAAYVIVEN